MVNPITVLTRAVKGAALSWTQQDTNISSVADAVNQIIAWMTSVASTAGGGLVGWISDLANAVARTLGDRAKDEAYVTDHFTLLQILDVRARTRLLDVGAAMQLAINALAAAGGGRLRFPRGSYKCVNQPEFKNGIHYIGDGCLATEIYCTGTGDGVVVKNPISLSASAPGGATSYSTVASIVVSGITFNAPNAAISPMRAAFADNGSSEIIFERNRFIAPGVGLILDQSELAEVQENVMAGGKAGMWMVNGPDRTPYADLFYTNRIKIEKNQFNGSGAYIGIVDDGGSAHEINSNNFNAGTTYVRVASCNQLFMTGGENESCTGSGVDFVTTRWQSGVAAGISIVATINGAHWSQGTTNSPISVAAGALDTLIVEGNNLFLPAGTTFISGSNNLIELHARGNRQYTTGGPGWGVLDVINNYFSGQFFTPTLNGATTNPVLGTGGTASGSVSRSGRRCTADFEFVFGSSGASFGSGNWQIPLPYAPTGLASSGTATMRCAGGLYTGIVEVQVGGGYALILSPNNNVNAVQATVPATWAAGNTLRGTVSWIANNKLN